MEVKYITVKQTYENTFCKDLTFIDENKNEVDILKKDFGNFRIILIDAVVLNESEKILVIERINNDVKIFSVNTKDAVGKYNILESSYLGPLSVERGTRKSTLDKLIEYVNFTLVDFLQEIMFVCVWRKG